MTFLLPKLVQINLVFLVNTILFGAFGGCSGDIHFTPMQDASTWDVDCDFKLTNVDRDLRLINDSPNAVRDFNSNLRDQHQVAPDGRKSDSAIKPAPFTHPYLLYQVDELASIKATALSSQMSPLGVRYVDSVKNLTDSAQYYINNPYAIHYDAMPCLNNSTTIPYNYTFSSVQPPRHINCEYVPWTHICDDITSRLVVISLAYSITGNQPFAKAAKDMMIAVSKWGTWRDPDYAPDHPGGLDNMYLTRGVAIGYDLLYDYLSASERAVIRKALVDKGITPVYNEYQDRPFPEDNYVANTYIYAAATSGLGALSVFKEESNAPVWLAKSVDSMRNIFSKEGLDGSFYESFLYGSFVSYLYELIVGLKNVDYPEYQGLLNYSFVQKNSGFLHSMTAPSGEFPHFADDSGSVFDTNIRRILYFYLRTGTMGVAEAGSLLSKFPQLNDPIPFPVIWYKDTILKDITAQSAVFTGAMRVATLRNGWDPEKPYLAFKSAPTAQYTHQHYDINSFILEKDKYLILTDPGYVNYYPAADRNYGTSTEGHNSILVDSTNQTNRSGGSIVSFYTSSKYDYVSGDAASAYPSNLQMTKMRRNIIYLKQDPPYYLIYDEMDSSLAHSYTLLFHTKGFIKSNGTQLDIGYLTRAKIDTISSSSLSSFSKPSPIYANWDASYGGINSLEKKKHECFLSVVFPYTGAGVMHSFDHTLTNHRDGDGRVFSAPSGLSLAYDSSTSVSGKYSLKVTSLANASSGILEGRPTNYIRVDPSQTYKLSAYVKSNDNAQIVSIGLKYLDKAKNVLSTNFPTLNQGTPPTTWTKYEASIGPNSPYPFPQGTEYVHLYFTQSYKSNPGWTWWDDIYFGRTDTSGINYPTIEKNGDSFNVKYANKTDLVVLNCNGGEKTIIYGNISLSTSAPVAVVRSDGSIIVFGGSYKIN